MNKFLKEKGIDVLCNSKITKKNVNEDLYKKHEGIHERNNGRLPGEPTKLMRIQGVINSIKGAERAEENVLRKGNESKHLRELYGTFENYRNECIRFSKVMNVKRTPSGPGDVGG